MSIKSILIRIQLFSLAVLTGSFVFAIPTYAQNKIEDLDVCNLGGGRNCFAQGTLNAESGNIQESIASAIQFFLPIIIVIGIVFLLFGAFQFITGKPEEGKKTIVNSIIGIVIALLAVTLVSFIINFIRNAQ